MAKPYSEDLRQRVVATALLRREPDPDDRRRVRLGLTDAADRQLAGLSAAHLDELRRLRPALLEILEGWTGRSSGPLVPTRPRAARQQAGAVQGSWHHKPADSGGGPMTIAINIRRSCRPVSLRGKPAHVPRCFHAPAHPVAWLGR